MVNLGKGTGIFINECTNLFFSDILKSGDIIFL